MNADEEAEFFFVDGLPIMRTVIKKSERIECPKAEKISPKYEAPKCSIEDSIDFNAAPHASDSITPRLHLSGMIPIETSAWDTGNTRLSLSGTPPNDETPSILRRESDGLDTKTKEKQNSVDLHGSSGEYEVVPLSTGGFKRRRIGNLRWQYYCQHGRQRPTCKQCGGTSLCKHNRQRSVCKLCCHDSLCEHGLRRGKCKQCRNSSVGNTQRDSMAASDPMLKSNDGNHTPSSADARQEHFNRDEEFDSGGEGTHTTLGTHPKNSQINRDDSRSSYGAYEVIPRFDGGFKRRRIGATQWQHYCCHNRQRQGCKQCHALKANRAAGCPEPIHEDLQKKKSCNQAPATADGDGEEEQRAPTELNGDTTSSDGNLSPSSDLEQGARLRDGSSEIAPELVDKKKSSVDRPAYGDYEIVPRFDGSFKKRRLGALRWQYYCEHGRQRAKCKRCNGSEGNSKDGGNPIPGSALSSNTSTTSTTEPTSSLEDRDESSSSFKIRSPETKQEKKNSVRGRKPLALDNDTEPRSSPDKYEVIPRADGGFKRRRIGASQWQYYCLHNRQKIACKLCKRAKDEKQSG